MRLLALPAELYPQILIHFSLAQKRLEQYLV